jgi:serine/threonine protein kinase
VYVQVYQVQKKDTEHVYAMKVLRKKHLITTGALEGTMVEREVLRSFRHPFIVSLHYAFQTEGSPLHHHHHHHHTGLLSLSSLSLSAEMGHHCQPGAQQGRCTS